MTTVINREDVPSHLLNIPELDFSEDFFAERLSDLWFRLGAWTIAPRRDERGVEDVVFRQSLLLSPPDFVEIFDSLESVDNAIGNLGKPSGYVTQKGTRKQYGYAPFHRFEIPSTSTVVEPLVFVHHTTSGAQLFINPDLWLFSDLEEQTPNAGLWWDRRRGVEALRRRLIAHENLEIVEIRTDYLLRYLQARQLSLIVGHYRHLHLFNPSASTIEKFVEGELTLGSREQGAKAVLQNWWLRKGIAEPFLQRQLHLWFQIEPPPIDIEDPWADQPSFDPYTFTLPTRVGPVAPARWKHFRPSGGRSFEGEACDFMDRVYFRQEVLMKYEGASGFDVADDGSVSCRDYWGLVRSTRRLGNELLGTAIGDFAEGVPFEEWPHWKQYAVEPPSQETAAVLREERTVAAAVNSVVKALHELNGAFVTLALSLAVANPDAPWRGSLDSLAGRQLKWVYPTTADDDEFLKRATLISTLVLDALAPVSLRKLLAAMNQKLHMNDETPPRPLGSRNLLQRVTLIAALIEDFRPDMATIPMLVMQAEGRSQAAEADLQTELETLYRRLREEFAPLAFLYDLRTHGGLAHHPDATKAAAAAEKLGLPGKSWHRTDYLRLLSLVANSILRISQHLKDAASMSSAVL
jgi:hypothetical protein